MLFLTKYVRRASYSDGATYIGLIEAEDEKAATLKTAAKFCRLEEPDECDFLEDREDCETKEEIVRYESRLAKWIEKERAERKAKYLEEVQKVANSMVEVSHVGGPMLLIATERCKYND